MREALSPLEVQEESILEPPWTPLGVNDIRIILTWGEEPRDLDVHLTGPDEFSDGSTSDEENRFHLYFNTMSSCCDVARIDVDDTAHYGPETITIFPPSGASALRNGLYRFTVFHYHGSQTLATSDAAVRLVFGNGDRRTFTPPSDDYDLAGMNGDIWTVFELVISDGSVTVLPVGTYGSGYSSGSVR
jgi:hypothetical protein